jgi:rod shape determining protein RodA
MTVLAPVGSRPTLRERVLGRKDEPHPLLHADWFLVAIVLAITGIGLAMIWSTTNAITQLDGLSRMHYVIRQAVALGLGLIAMAVTASFDYRRWKDLWPLIYGLVVPLLIAVRFLGGGQGGTTAWFDLGPLQFQPSEVAKLAIVIAVASYCHAHRGELDAWRLAVAVMVAGFAMGLTMLQNDLGTMLVMGACAVGILYVSGLRAVHMAVLLGLAGSCLAALLLTGTFNAYRLERLGGFLNQDRVEDATEASATEYNLQQSKDAIANGGLWGEGFGQGQLTQNGFVPEQHTDFIFTAVGEELGFAGATGLLALFALLCWRIWRAAMLSQDFQGTLLCIGVLGIMVFQIFENVGMTMGIMPITGIPLPFVSYGGSALIAYYAAIGIVLNVHLRRFS